MKLIKSFFKIVTQFLRHLSLEYAHPCFYANEKREAQLKKEQVCCEVEDIIRRHQIY